MAVDPNIKKKANDIRNKVYGKEVRESLASGLEEMSSDVVENEGRQSVVESRQDSVESQWQNVVDETTGKDVISAPEIIAARDGEANLKARLDKEKQEVTAQLTQTDREVKNVKRNYWERKPVFALIDDDGHRDVYSKLMPMLESRGLKGSFSIATSYTNNHSSFMTSEQILEAKSRGHEILNHSHTNIRLAQVSESEIRHEFETSKRILREMGIESDVFVYPNGSYNKKVVDIAKEYFSVAVDDNSGRNDTYPLSTYSIKRIGVGPWGLNDFDLIKEQIDGAIENNELCVLMTHIGQNTNEQDILLENVLDYIVASGVKFTTFSDAYDQHKNILEYGEYNGETEEMGLSIGADGSIGGSQSLNVNLPVDEISNTTPPRYFKSKKNYRCRITHTNASTSGLPLGQQGVLITDTTGLTINSYNIVQWYSTSQNNKVFRRYATDVDEWSEWELSSSFTTLTEMNAYNGSNALEDFPVGTTITEIQASYSDDFLPTKKGGTLTTTNTGSLAGWSYQRYKEYGANNEWMRTATDKDSWSEWEVANRHRYTYTMSETIPPKTVVSVTTIGNLNYTSTANAMPMYRMTGGIMYTPPYIDGEGTLIIRVYNTRDESVTINKDWIIDVFD